MVAIMFAAISGLVPLLQGVSTKVTLLAGVTGMLASAGTYKILAGLLSTLLRRFPWVKRIFLGPYYMEGTWVGHFIGHAGDVRYVVETFEQELDSLCIRGYSFTADDVQHGQWTSEAAQIDTARGKLTYTYTCDILTRGVPHQGVGVFDLQRKSKTSPPHAILGYVADVVDGQRLPVKEVRISNTSLLPEDALGRAKKVKVHKIRETEQAF
jgi:hypothetical protein